MLLERLFNAASSGRAERKVYSEINPRHIGDGSRVPREFKEGEAYFKVRLSEMFLRDERRWWREFVPITVCLGQFIFDGKRQEVPFVVSNQLLRADEKYVNGANIEYRNTTIIGPVPYVGDGISLFAALYRAKVNELSVGLFGFMGNLAKSFDVSGLSKYLDIAQPLAKGLEDVLGMRDVEFCMGIRNEIRDAGREKGLRETLIKLALSTGSIGKVASV